MATTNNNNNAKSSINTTEQYTQPSFQISQSQIDDFQRNGFIAFPNVFDAKSVCKLNHRLELVLRGVYNTGIKPDKTPKLIKLSLPSDVVLKDEEKVEGRCGNSINSTDLMQSRGGCEEKREKESLVIEESNHTYGNDCRTIEEDETNHQSTTTRMAKSKKKLKTKKPPKSIGPLGYSGNKQNIKVMQIINVHKCDFFFRQLVTTRILGYMVSKLMKWSNGARLAQDQIWAKPPGSPPLAYHRDAPYFMFTPSSVATVWIALDDMYEEEIGPLQYVKGSHLWNDGRVGSSQNFFQSNGGKALLYSAAERSGIEDCKNSLEYVSMKGLQAGGLSIHDGRTWHGSGGNKSDRPRRGIGLHFVPVEVKWTESAMNSRLWRRYVEDIVKDDGDIEAIELDERDFPVVYRA